MLAGEPYLLEYQRNIVHDLHDRGFRIMDDLIPKRVLFAILDMTGETRAKERT